MNSWQRQHNDNTENRAIIDALKQQPSLPGVADTDAVFLMHLDVPEKILEKLRAR